MGSVDLCLQQASQRMKQRPARYARMTVVSLLLIYVVHQSMNYSGSEESHSDVPHVDQVSSHPHRLRLRVRSRSSLKVKPFCCG